MNRCQFRSNSDSGSTWHGPTLRGNFPRSESSFHLCLNPNGATSSRRDMKISTILDHIASAHIARPEFQRGYVWNRDQVRGLLDSLYHRQPVGGLLVWATESTPAAHRGE